MIKRKKFILFVLLFLIATSSIITWANSQNEDTPNNDPKKDVIADFDSEDKKDNQENNNPDTHNKEDEDVDKDKNENKDNSNINNEDDEKKDENTDGNEEKDNKKKDDIKNQDNQTTNPSNPIDIDNTKKENQINNTTGNILNTENISKDFHIEGNKLVKYNGTQEYVVVPDGKHEGVYVNFYGKENFNKNKGLACTEKTDSKNMGTYNFDGMYYSIDLNIVVSALNHYLFDMQPYYAFGNTSRNDLEKKGESTDDNKIRYDKNEDAKSARDFFVKYWKGIVN